MMGCQVVVLDEKHFSEYLQVRNLHRTQVKPELLSGRVPTSVNHVSPAPCL